MSSDIVKRGPGRPRKNREPETHIQPKLPRDPAKRRRNIIGMNVPYVAPEVEQWTGSAVGYRPKTAKRRPILQPNRV